MGKRESWRKEVTGESEIRQTLASGNPLTSRTWWVFKHPATRLLIAIGNLVLHLYVYYGDPATFSNAESYGTLIGDIYAGFFEPDDWGYIVARLLVMVLLLAFGVFVGVKFHRWLRDSKKLRMFGYDKSQGADPNFKPGLSSQDGAVFLVFMAVTLSWFIGLKLYNGLLSLCGQTDHRTDAGMHGWTYASYNLLLAGTFTWVSDWYLVLTVADQMLQSLRVQRDRSGKVTSQPDIGYLAYAKGSERVEKATAWWNDHRLATTRVLLLVGWVAGLWWQIAEFLKVIDTLNKDGKPGAHVGRSPAWSRSWSDEFMRMLFGAIVALFNMLIVMQDWGFPDFAGDDIKIVAVDFDAIHLDLPDWIKETPIYISSKWFNYFGTLMGIAFDWGYWYMTALPFRPCDYGMLWDSKTDLMYMLAKPQKLVDEHVSAPSAKDCPWFTDNYLLRYARDPFNATEYELDTGSPWTYGHEPSLVRIDCGVFTGTYTIDEDDNYVWFKKRAWLMNIMCAIPILGLVALVWLVLNHERVTCFNKKRVATALRKATDDSTATDSTRRYADKVQQSLADQEDAGCCSSSCCRGAGHHVEEHHARHHLHGRITTAEFDLAREVPVVEDQP